MKIAYKLTDSKMRTCNGFQWEIGKWYETTGEGELCSPSWLHFYSDSLVGLFLNPVHAGIENPRLFCAEVEGKFLDDNELKCGYSRARLIEELPVPQISPVQRVRFAIFCAKKVYKEKEWNKWANNWLSGKGRTIDADWSTKYNFCTICTMSASRAAESAFFAARIALSTTENTFYTIKSAESAAESVFYAIKSKKIDLIGIARKAMKK